VEYPTSQSKVDGTFINYVKVGCGPPIVFIHGWSNNWQGWAPIIPFLKERFTLYLVDLPGFGDSGNLPAYSIEITADTIAEFIKIEKIVPEAVVGISMGTFVVGELGIRHPEASKRIILTSPILKGSKQRFLSKDVLYNLKFLNASRFTKGLLKSIMSRPVTAHYLSRYLMMYHYDKKVVDECGVIGKAKMRIDAFIQMGISACHIVPTQMVTSIPVKTLLIVGDKDKLASISYIKKELLPQNKQLSLTIVADAGHAAPWEKPEEISNAIKQFITLN